MKKIFFILIIAIALVITYRFFSSSGRFFEMPAGGNIICLGDSLTAGEGAAEGGDYPSQLSRLIGKPIINAGRSGDTTQMVLARLKKDVLERSPGIVLVMLGANDVLQKIPNETIFQNLKDIILSIQQEGALIIVAGFNIPLVGRNLDAEFKKLTKGTGAILIPDILHDVLENRRHMSDHIHPNEAGYAIIAERFDEILKRYLD